MKGDSALTAIVSAASIYPQATPALPAFPFIRAGAPTLIPRRASCLDGAEITQAFHGFSKGRYTGDRILETAEDHASRIGSAMASALDGKHVDLGSGRSVRIRWTGSQLLQDPEEASAFHTVQNFLMRVFA